ncbi:MAG: hypothetical protein M5U32_11680 [Myxococcota bacterium]|nr:hypothetical protein [Myxococcota bacterium]
MAVRRLALAWAIAAATLGIGVLVGAGDPVRRQARAATSESAAHALLHQIELPGGAHIRLRREYRDMFRSRMAWG